MDISFTGINEIQFEQVFKEHFKALYAYALTILKDEDTAEDTVQQVFFKLWEKKEQIEIQQSIKAYLYSSVYNQCMNLLKHEQVKKKHQTYLTHATEKSDESATKKLIANELEQKISDALNLLPQQCRTIFQMSRFEELKYREIAENLSISVKTVEAQMSKALKIMRKELEIYLPILLVFLDMRF